MSANPGRGVARAVGVGRGEISADAGRWLSALVLLLAGLFLSVSAMAIDPSESFDDPEMQARYEKLTEELRCLVCQNQTIGDSSATLAQDLRREVREMMEQGKSDKEILDFMVDRYGDFVRYRPPLAPRTWLLWFGPALMLLIGGFILWRTVRARSGMSLDDDDPLEEGA